MTPLRGIIGRISGRRPADANTTGGGAATPSAPARTPSTQPRAEAGSDRSGSSARQGPDTNSNTQERPAASRSRGSRGGRGRGGRGKNTSTENTTTTTQAPQAAPEPKAAAAKPAAYSWGKKASDDESARQVLEERRRDRNRRRGRYRPPGKLEAPLPEDVAFRSADEGGDRSILPARRRRPKGLRTTERVLVGGARMLTGFVSRPFNTGDLTPHPLEAGAHAADRSTPPGAGAAVDAEADVDATLEADVDTTIAGEPDMDAKAVAARELAAASSADTGDGAAATRKRRRGRRGGRGRRRPEQNGATAAGAHDEHDEHDERVAEADVAAQTEVAEPAQTEVVAASAQAEPEPTRTPRSAETTLVQPTPAEETTVEETPAPARRTRRRPAATDDRATSDRSTDTAAAADADAGAAASAAEANANANADANRASAADAGTAVAEPTTSRGTRRSSSSGRRTAPAAAIADADLPAAFSALGLARPTLELLAGYGFGVPTPIQERAVPELLNGRDVVGIAQTGSGKTIAFGAPMVERLDPDLRAVQAIVLVPTRELAQQVLEVIANLGAPYGLEAVGLLGGRSLDRDFKALERNPHIVVGTPGRIIDHLGRRTLSLRQVRYAVLDEADQMLDIGFMPDIRRILGRTPRARQTALFSATMPTSIQRLVYQFMHDPVTCSVDPELSTVESVQQIYYEVASRDKVRGLKELVERELKGRTLVFCKMKRGVDRVAQRLDDAGVRVGALHGDMDQSRRDHVVRDFREGKLDILIATNVAARGLDIPEITHVVNFDFPQNLEEYVHRIGRTGRAGRDGKAITFVCEDDLDALVELQSEFGDRLTTERLELY